MNESENIGDGIDLENTEANIRKIERTDPSELGEGGPAIVFEVPDDLDYAGQEIEDVLWNGTGILIWYQPDNWDRDYLHLHAEGRDGTIVVTGYGPSLLQAHEAFGKYSDAPHAESLRPIYEWLMDEGVEFEDYND